MEHHLRKTHAHRQDILSGIPSIVDTLPVDMGNWLRKQLEAHAAGESGRKVEMAVEGSCEVHLLPDQDREKAVRMATALKARMLGLLQAHTLRHAISGRVNWRQESCTD